MLMAVCAYGNLHLVCLSRLCLLLLCFCASSFALNAIYRWSVHIRETLVVDDTYVSICRREKMVPLLKFAEKNRQVTLYDTVCGTFLGQNRPSFLESADRLSLHVIIQNSVSLYAVNRPVNTF